jgi:hypothetical protein
MFIRDQSAFTPGESQQKRRASQIPLAHEDSSEPERKASSQAPISRPFELTVRAAITESLRCSGKFRLIAV